MKRNSPMKKSDDYKEETDKLKSEASKNKESSQKSEIITSIETNNIIFGRDQQICACPLCHMKIFTEIEHEISWLGIVLCILMIIFFKIIGIILSVVVIRFTQNTTHSCPNCLNRIGVYTVFDALSLQDKVFSIKFSSFGIVITKKHLFSIVLGLIFIILFITLISNVSFTKQILKESWSDYVKICAQGETLCNTKFLYQEISWLGYVIRVNFNDNFFSRNRVYFLIKMDENAESDKTDLIIEVTDRVYNKYKIDILNITRGDEIEFNATVRQNPNYQTRVPIVTLDEMKITGRSIYINPHVHEDGRYGTQGGRIDEGQKVYNELPNVVSKGKKNLQKNNR
jgi:hypothetical protein